MTSSTGDDENFILGNIILKIAHLYLWETLPLKKTLFFILSHVTDLLPINFYFPQLFWYVLLRSDSKFANIFIQKFNIFLV